MPSALDQFVQQVIDSGLLSAVDVRALIDSLPTDERPQEADHVARELVRRKLLTAYQVEQIQAGQGRSLVLGNYVILDKLGQGGMGLVLKAEHRRMKRLVALKVLSPQVVRTPELLRRFQREVEAAAKLSHPNIVIAHDADEAGGTHFLVMEYVDGTDLSTLVKQRGPLPIDQALDFIVQAARGLEYAHQHGVIHRDVKPANLLVSVVSRPLSVAADDRTITAEHGQLTTDHGPRTTLKILDMGLARVESGQGAQDELTGSGQIMGTVDYMAPEQAANTKRADQRADIYSLGITLWYLLTGRPAYPGETAVEKLLAHQTQPIPSLRSQRPAVSPALDAAFAKMVAKTPEARYQTMTEVIAALESCRSTASGPAADPEATLDLSPPQVATDPKTQASLAAPRPWWRDRRLTVVVAGAALILLTVWIAGVGREWLLGDASPTSKDTPPKTTPGPVAADLKSEIPDLKFEEPPPLEEWLKGRTILTVAQDGRGQFRTIADAVKALKPGHVVEILDQGPYRENLWIENPPADTAVVSRAAPIIAPKAWRPSPRDAAIVLPHFIQGSSSLRISGLVLFSVDDARANDRVAKRGPVTWFQQGPAVLENSILLESGLYLNANGLATVRNSVISFGLELLGPTPEANRLLYRNWIVAPRDRMGATITIGASVRGGVAFEENIVDGQQGIWVYADEIAAGGIYFRQNTISAPTGLLSEDVFDKASWTGNLLIGSIYDRRSHESVSLGDGPRRSRIRYNLLWPRDLNKAARLGSLGIDTLVEEPQWLSLDPRDHRNYMRVSNPSVVLNRDGKQEYIGALPPGPAPPEGDWFTRMLERWEEVQQRIEILQADDAAGARVSSSGSPKPALPAPNPRP